MASLRDRVFAEILAEIDGTFSSVRKWDSRHPANAYQLQEQYKTLGVRWESRAGLDAERKALDRALGELEATGAVKVTRTRGSRFPYIRLADDAAEDRIRKLVCMPDLMAAWSMLKTIADKSLELGCDLVSETQLFEPGFLTTDMSSQANLTEWKAVPAIIRGWLHVSSDRIGRVYYALTDAGRKAIDCGAPASSVALNFDEALSDLYFGRLREVIARMETASPPNPREIGYLPVPESGPYAEHFGPGVPAPVGAGKRGRSRSSAPKGCQTHRLRV